MSPGSPSLPEILDEAAGAVTRVAAPWLGILWLSALPVRLLQADFAAELLALGSEAPRYRAHLTGLASAVFLALVPALAGRAVFARACLLSLRSPEVSLRAGLRVPPAGLLSFLYVALLIETAFYALAPSLVAVPPLVLAAGLAAATCGRIERPTPLAPLREIARQLSHPVPLAGLLFVFAAALLLALVNVFFVFRIGLWLAAALPGFDPAPWSLRLAAGNPRFLLALVSGATLLVEPFWLAALVVYVHKARSLETGEDLRAWFERLRARSPA